MRVSCNWLSRHVDLNGVDLDALGRRFTMAVAELGKSTWLTGETLTAADIQMSFPLEGAIARAAGTTKRPHIAAFVARVHEREAYQRALARGGPFTLG